MGKPYLLHMLTPTKNLSPFDVNMAYDAGWTAAIPYVGVDLGEVPALIQDAIFSRGPQGVRRTGIFIGGRDMHMAMDMLASARAAMVPPFEISVFADPSGAFTTAAGLVAAVERQLKQQGASLARQRVLVLGGTGPVGCAAATLAAKAGAEVTVHGRRAQRAEEAAQICNDRYGADMISIRGAPDERKDELLKNSDVVLATAKAGVQVMTEKQVAEATNLKVAADVNAVPPAGVAGVGVQDDGVPLAGSPSNAVGIGALAIGNIKYQTQHNLLTQMRELESPVYFDFEHAFNWARDHVG